MPSMDKVKKIIIGCISEPKIVLEFFFIMALDVVNEGGTPYMGISPGRARASFIRLHCCTGRVSLKKCVFSCEGK